jgi:putative heme-binding domain-containing protein
MSRSRFVAALALAALLTLVGAAQQGPPPTQAPAGPVPLPAPRGALSVSADAAAAIVAAVKAPPGFTVTAFATPPVINYPTCVTATHDGVIFVCVDRNGSLQADPGMGYVARVVDKDQNGQADEYTVFATMDSPRGAVFDGDTLYVSHPPFVTAFRDTDRDGIADERRTLVRGLGFGLDFRGADHTTNGIEMGIDGWLYVAVGDYGFVKAVGADGHEIQLRGGGNVRVRPDGSELEIYSRGTRNDYDLGIDPYLNMFARGNTNDGGGFDIRLYHFVAGASFGYPSLFRNFSDEVLPPLADYGTGSGTGMLYVHDSGLPSPYGDTLYSDDRGRNAIYRHPLQAKGATFAVQEEPFLTVPRPNDMAIDASSRLYVASWSGGQYRYAGENIGYLVRLTHDKATPAPVPDLGSATDARLVELVVSSNQVHRRFAQSALLRRGRSPERIALLERGAGTGSLQGRVAALFTLKQLAGTDATAALVTLAADPAMRAFALRALADRRGELASVPKPLFVKALTDPDPRVQLQAITGLGRLGATDAAGAILRLTASPDIVVSHVAINTLVALGAIDAPLAALSGPSGAVAKGALRVLQQLHQPQTVSGLLSALGEAKVPERRAGILQALARLHNRDGVWRGTIGEWWGTRPDTTGPYYDPVAWEESGRIRATLTRALLQTSSGPVRTDVPRLVTDLERNRVLPAGGADLLGAMARESDPAFAEIANTLVGKLRLEVDPALARTLEPLARRPAYRGPIVKMIVAAGPPTAPAGAILHAIAVDSTVAPDVRAAALTAIAAGTGAEALGRSIDAFASLVAPTLDPALEPVWRQFIGSSAHAASVATFRELTAASDRSRQRLGYSVLLQLAADPPAAIAGGGRGGQGRGGGGGGRGRGGVSAAALDAARTEARQAIDNAWSGPSAASLVWAVGRTGATRYRDRVDALQGSADAGIREAVLFASAALTAATPSPSAASETSAAPAVSTIPYEELIGRLASVKGDAALGRTLFARQACSACHTTSPSEPEKGPYLGGISTRYSKAELLESIMRPSAKVAQGFATVSITTTDKRQLTGFVVREAPDEVVIRDIAGAETTVRKTQIAARAVSEGSIMPPGLVDGLTLSELASMLAFLESTVAK